MLRKFHGWKDYAIKMNKRLQHASFGTSVERTNWNIAQGGLKKRDHIAGKDTFMQQNLTTNMA